MRIRGMLFDFDDTIVDSESTNTEILRAFLLKEFSITLSPEDEQSTYYYSWKDTFPLLRSRFRISLPYEEMWKRFMAAKASHLSRHTLRVARGAADILSLPVPKAVVSGSMREEIALMMENVGMSPAVFTAIVTAEDVEKCKPDPEGFLKAVQRLGVPAGESVVFEDSPIGLAAARACGIPSAFIREFAWKDTCGEADFCFDTLQDACMWVRGRIGAVL